MPPQRIYEASSRDLLLHYNVCASPVTHFDGGALLEEEATDSRTRKFLEDSAGCSVWVMT